MKIKQIKPKALLKALIKLGFLLKGKREAHVFLERSLKNQKRFTSISLHNKPLPKGTLKTILKQTGVSEDEIKKCL